MPVWKLTPAPHPQSAYLVDHIDVFELHRDVVDDYASYTRSFINFSDERIANKVETEISEGLLWPDRFSS